jgi:hypothetical protein
MEDAWSALAFPEAGALVVEAGADVGVLWYQEEIISMVYKSRMEVQISDAGFKLTWRWAWRK